MADYDDDAAQPTDDSAQVDDGSAQQTYCEDAQQDDTTAPQQNTSAYGNDTTPDATAPYTSGPATTTTATPVASNDEVGWARQELQKAGARSLCPTLLTHLPARTRN